jgi:preprotein translocase subunit SecE
VCLLLRLLDSIMTKLSQWPSQIVTFFREARDELKKVAWPTRQTTVRYTMIVIVSSIAVGLVLGSIDYILVQVLERFIL